MQKAAQVARFGGEQLKETYQRYERYWPALAFAAGSLFDIVTIGRIDDTMNIVQLGIYLLIVTLLLAVELLEREEAVAWPAKLAGRVPLFGKLWRYRDEATHFLFGSLLSAFTIFYFKSSSIWGALAFFIIITACLIGNEFESIRKVGVPLRMVLYCVCLTSLLFCVVPMLWRRVGFLPFVTSLILSGGCAYLFSYLLGRRVKSPEALMRQILYPYCSMLGAFLILYLFHVIPPVPLSLKHIGIYHGVERVAGGYKVAHRRPVWKFWETGDQTFEARRGDRIYCFFSVFSPGGFSDSIKIRWLYDDPKRGWQKLDAVPVAITGGREQGYRGFAFKANFQPGDWQVRIETMDELEIGRINLTVSKDESSEPIVMKDEVI